MAQTVKNPPANAGDATQSLGPENPLEKEMETHFMFLPGESHGHRRLAGNSPWSHKGSDRTEQLALSLSIKKSWETRRGNSPTLQQIRAQRKNTDASFSSLPFTTQLSWHRLSLLLPTQGSVFLLLKATPSFPFLGRLAQDSPWLQTLYCSSLLIPNKPVLAGETFVNLFLSGQQNKNENLEGLYLALS